MQLSEQPTIRRATDDDAPAIAEIHLQSRRVAMPWLPVVHTDEETHAWIAQTLLKNEEVWVAEENGVVIGYAALAPGWLEHLYIHPEHQGEGIGRRLLDLAKGRQPQELQLWAFTKNARARRFYEAAGFVLIDETDGAGNEEREPDVRYLWRPQMPVTPENR
jgi:ribosomal protein S18 acetylase RimI-like enzyme